jgi:hypothetical protein
MCTFLLHIVSICYVYLNVVSFLRATYFRFVIFFLISSLSLFCLKISFWTVVPTCLITLQPKVKYGERTVSISLEDESMEYLSGHVIDGRNLFPAAGYLVS